MCSRVAGSSSNDKDALYSPRRADDAVILGAVADVVWGAESVGEKMSVPYAAASSGSS